VPRSAFLEDAREVGGTMTGRGAPAKQKTAAPPGVGLLALAVLKSEAAELGVKATTPLR